MTEPRTRPAQTRSRWWRRTRAMGLLLLFTLVGGVVGVRLVTGDWPWFRVAEDEENGRRGASAVKAKEVAKVIRPHKDVAFQLHSEQLATIEPLFSADLKARASGTVRTVTKNIGDTVKQGELLIEIDVPEFAQDVAQKTSGVLQRQVDVKVAKAKLKDAQAMSIVSQSSIKLRQAELAAAMAKREFSKKRFDRFKELVARGSILGGVADEEEQDYKSSLANVDAAQAAVARAKSDFDESLTKIEVANADIELKESMVDGAQKELDRANIVAKFAQITAPFDGIITRRNVDPGSFIQNSTTGAGEPLISLVRTDVVTVSAKFTDNVAAYLTRDTPATITVDQISGLTIETKVTRFSPSISRADRTMRVEIDLFNGTKEEQAAAFNTSLAGKADDSVPTPAFGTDPSRSANAPRLLAGMTAKLNIGLGKRGESAVIPSSAIYTRSGSHYIMLVEGGKTKQYPVRVRVNDGKTATVALVTLRRDPTGLHEVWVDLTGNELVVAARQLELGEGKSVRTSLTEW